MNKNFWTGLVLFLPIILTIMILVYTINLLTDPFVGIMEAILLQFPLETSPEILTAISKAVLLILFAFMLMLIGFFIQHLFGYYLFAWSDSFFYKIPVINKLYGLIQETVQTLFATNLKDFKVVLAKFPQSTCYAIGILTQEKTLEQEFSTVMLSGTNPTISFTLWIKRDDLIVLDAKAEEALKFMLSYGMMNSAFTVTDK